MSRAPLRCALPRHCRTKPSDAEPSRSEPPPPLPPPHLTCRGVSLYCLAGGAYTAIIALDCECPLALTDLPFPGLIKMTSRQRDIGRKYESGAEKERAKRKREAFIETQRGAINKFLRPAHLESKSGSGNVEDTCSSSTGDGERGNHEEPPRPPSSGPTSVAPPMEESPGSREPSPAASAVGPSLEPPIVSEDPGNWPRHIDANTKRILVERGPPKITKPYIFPKSEGRGFSEDFCRYTLVNGEKSERSWLIYSKQKDSAYCFCCRIFSDLSRHDTRTSALSKEEGFRDWKHCSERLRKHQCSPEHFKHFAEWTELEQRLAEKSTVDKVNEGKIDRERKHWQDVLTRILAGVQYLAETNSAFRGSSSTLYERDNGNFLKLMEMLATFDPPMREHLRRVRDKKTHVHYMGPEIQNEMISLIGTATKEKILEEVRAAKYFGIILDCTPDISHQEQMTLVLRYVDMTGIPNIVERFVEFLKVDDSSGEGLTDELINALEKNNLEIMDARAQDYDNGSNMKGKEKGVQSRVKKINKRAMHVSCCAHSLNLVLCEMASCHKEAMTFFGVIQRLYTLVSASTKRWDIFKVYCTNLTLKPLSDTRWESHVESVKTVRFQLGNVCSALEKIAETTSDPAVRSEALSLVEHSLKSLEFVLGLVLWYDLLQAVNRVSKTLQAVDSTLDTTLQHLQGLKSFIQDYRENGFKKALTTARELVESLGCESEFKVPRIRRPKPQLGQKRTREPNRSEEVSHQELQDEAEEKFRIGYFLPILDVALTSMSSRFEEIEFYASKFGFLFNPSKLSDQEDEKLEEFCKNLAIYLKDGDSEDIDETDFVAEMKSFKYVVPSSVTTALGALRYLGPIRESYPNLTIALRIMLTIPMTVASGERSFSKLKIIKNYLRSTMSQARLNDLAMISIEREVAHSLRMDELISNFAYAKARRAPFL